MIPVTSSFVEECKVTNKLLSKMTYPLDPGRIDNLVLTKKIAFVVTLNTLPAQTKYKIYDEYGMDLKLVGDFNYRIDN